MACPERVFPLFPSLKRRVERADPTTRKEIIMLEGQANKEEKELCALITKYVNQMGNSPEVLARLLSKAHPTLQQSIMRLFLLYCEEIALKPYYDGRNEASGELAKKVVALNVCLPFI